MKDKPTRNNRLCRLWAISACVLVTLAGHPLHAQNPLPWLTQYEVDLGDNGFDFDCDLSRNLVYVVVPDSEEIVYVSMVSGKIVARQPIASPISLDYGPFSDRIYVAMNQDGKVAVVDPDSRTATEIDVSGVNGTGHHRTRDAVEAADGLVFATADGNATYVARIDIANGNLVTRVAGNEIIRSSTKFLKTHNERFLYLGEASGPNFLFKLDIIDPAAPIVLENAHGSVSGVTSMALSSDDSTLFTSSGQVLNTEDFSQIAMVGSGGMGLSSDETELFRSVNERLRRIDTTTFNDIGSYVLPDGFVGNPGFIVLPDNRGLIMLSQDSLLIATNASDVTPSGFSVPRGKFVSGSLSDLASSDDVDVRAIRNVFDISSRVFLEVESVSPVASPLGLSFTLEASVFARGEIQQSIDFYNYDAGAWEQVDFQIASSQSDRTAYAVATGDVSRFVQPVSNAIKARCRFEAVSQRLQFAANIDKAVWTID